MVEAFFAWIDRQFQRHGLLPSNPLTQALAYARERRLGLEIFLTDPDVPIDTNHLERALRARFRWAKKLELLLDGAGCQTRRHRAEPDRYVSTARCRSVYLSGRRTAA